MKPFRIKTGDQLPPLRLTLQDLNDAGRVLGPADLSTAEAVYFNMKDEAGELIIDHGEVEVLDEETGEVQYLWELADTLNPGKFFGEFEVHFPGDKTKTYPNDQEIPIKIRSAVG